MAERLGRTVEELLHGAIGKRPMSGQEMTAWQGFDRIRAWRHEKEMKRMQNRGSGAGRARSRGR